MKILLISSYCTIQKIKKYILLGTYFLLFLIAIAIQNNHQCGLSYLKIVLLILCCSWVILKLLIRPYKIIGNVILYPDGHAIIELDNKREKIIIKSIKVLYGGYDGDIFNVFEIFYKGTWSRDGTENFIFINDLKYQFYIGNFVEKEKLINFLKFLNCRGINIMFIQNTEQ